MREELKQIKGSPGYSGTPLPKKLGIREGFTVATLRSPDDFEQTLGDLPANVTIRRQMRGRLDLVIWFVRSQKELDGRIERIAGATPRGGIWICWPKKSSGVSTDVGEGDVRSAGLAHGLVDYKIAAIDATWSGLKFARRKET